MYQYSLKNRLKSYKFGAMAIAYLVNGWLLAALFQNSSFPQSDCHGVFLTNQYSPKYFTFTFVCISRADLY